MVATGVCSARLQMPEEQAQGMGNVEIPQHARRYHIANHLKSADSKLVIGMWYVPTQDILELLQGEVLWSPLLTDDQQVLVFRANIAFLQFLKRFELSFLGVRLVCQ